MRLLQYGSVHRASRLLTVDDSLDTAQAFPFWSLVDMRPWLRATHLDSVGQSQIDRVKGHKKLIGAP